MIVFLYDCLNWEIKALIVIVVMVKLLSPPPSIRKSCSHIQTQTESEAFISRCDDHEHEPPWFHPIFSSPCVDQMPELIPVNVVKVYDGDTCNVVFRLFNDNKLPLIKFRVRLSGIDTAEMKGGTAATKQLARKARDFVIGKLVNVDYRAQVHFTNTQEKYGRLLGEFFIDGETKSINEMLVDAGLAKRYEGKTKEAWGEKKHI